jgi:predicted DCC family thiol-disulfide oxidoreductase YuxK
VSELDGMGDRVLVLYDGYCGLCNRSVRWFLRHDRRDRLRFVAFDSPMATGLLARHGIGSTEQGLGQGLGQGLDPSTMLVVRDPGGSREQLLDRSTGVLALLGELQRPWPAVGKALGWIPRAVRDLGYRLIARWRYRIWGRLESCPLPTAEERARFL